jgi:hypothetical protein
MNQIQLLSQVINVTRDGVWHVSFPLIAEIQTDPVPTRL